MKRFRIGALVILSCLLLISVGCKKKTTNYTVTYDSVGGTVVEAQIVEDGNSAKEPTAIPVKEGYTFDGWYIDLSYKEKYDFKKTITGNIILRAKWVKNSNVGKSECKLTCAEDEKLVNSDSEDCKCEKIKESSEKGSVTKITLNKTSITLVEGGKQTITATVKPKDATDKTVTWKSSNTKVATVNSNGAITAVGAGTATITATAGDKKATVKVTVITKDQNTLNKALNSMKAKTLTNGNTSIDYTYDECTITNTENTVSSNASAKTVVKEGTVTTLYRPASNGTITSTYSVVCGSASDTKKLTHTISASTYTYTAINNGMTYILKVNGATGYTLIHSNGTKASYLASAGGAQIGISAHKTGMNYDMILNNSSDTIYQVKSAE